MVQGAVLALVVSWAECQGQVVRDDVLPGRGVGAK